MNKQQNMLTTTMQHHKGNVMMISIRLSVVGRHIKLTPTYTILNTYNRKRKNSIKQTVEFNRECRHDQWNIP